jgi:acetyl esterase/lipase
MTKRIGWMGWLLIIAALLAAALYGAWRYALATNAVALLDWSDRQIGGTQGYDLALVDGRYGADPAQRVEVIVPDQPSQAPRPVLVFFHGGGWHSGQPGDYHFVGRTFARAGYVVILPGYRLVPEGRYPAMLEDGAAALAWTRDHAASHGGDPGRVAVMGHSAGAYIAAMLTLERQWLGRAGVKDGFVKAVVGLSGPYDFFPWTSDSARNAFGHAPDPALTQPVAHARGDAPPMLLLTGDADTTVRPRNSRALAQALSGAGRPTEPVVLSGVDHNATVMKLAAPFSRDRRVLDPVLAFLAVQTAPSAPVQAQTR